MNHWLFVLRLSQSFSFSLCRLPLLINRLFRSLFDYSRSCLFTNGFLICRWALWDRKLTLALVHGVRILFAMLGAGLKWFTLLNHITDFLDENFLLFFNFIVSWEQVVSACLHTLLNWLDSLWVSQGDFILWVCALRSRWHVFFISAGLVDCESGLWLRIPAWCLKFALLIESRSSRCPHTVPYRRRVI